MKRIGIIPALAFFGLAWLVVAGSGGLTARDLPPPRMAAAAGPRDLTLDEAIAMALRCNPQILVALEEIRRTRGRTLEVRSRALPRVALQASYQQQDRNLIESAAPPQLPVPDRGADDPPGPRPRPSPTPTPTPGPTPSPTPRPLPSPTPGQDVEALLNELSELFGTPPRQDKQWQVSIQATQTIYAGGRIAAGIRQARLAEDEASFQLRDTVETVIATVRRQFYRVQAAQAMIVVQEEAVALLESQFRDQSERYEAGTVPRFNVLQAEVALANARPALIAARNDYRSAQLELARTLGYSTYALAGQVPPFCIHEPLGMTPVRMDLPQAMETARERRAFLKAQRQQILMDVEEITIQRSTLKPTVQASGGYTARNSALSNSLGDVVHGWFFGIEGNWLIFDGFGTRGRVQQAKARLEQARYNYIASVQQVDAEVQLAWLNLQEALETIRSHRQTIVQAREAVRLARERLSAGTGTQLDVLNASVSLTQARSTEVEARLRYNAAAAELDRATGTATRYNESFADPLGDPKKRRYYEKRLRQLARERAKERRRE